MELAIPMASPDILIRVNTLCFLMFLTATAKKFLHMATVYAFVKHVPCHKV